MVTSKTHIMEDPMPDRPRIELLLTNRERANQARRSLVEAFGDRVEVVTGSAGRGNVKLVAIEDLPENYRAADPVVAVGDPTLPDLVDLLTRRPWLNHLISPKQFQTGAFPAALWQLAGRKLTPASFLGDGFQGRRATLRESERRSERVEAIVECARAAGATSRSSERVADLAEELLSNALYNAPAERTGKPVDRSVKVVLPKGEGCSVTYGASGPLFIVRVKDRCGSLRRERLVEVLRRCAAQNAVSIDRSRGGAGLGMWRIFSQSSLIVIQVKPGQYTDFIAGVDLKTRRSTEEVNRQLHLFIGTGAAVEESS
jgi:hypothetical protein